MEVKYFNSTLCAQTGWRRMSSVNRRVGLNGRANPLRALYSRFAETGESTVTISASNPLSFTRSISLCDSSRCFQT